MTACPEPAAGAYDPRVDAGATRRWQDALERDGEVVLRQRRGRASALLAVSAAFTVAALWLTLVEGPDLFGVVAVAFFGVLGIPVFAWSAVMARPHVLVTRDGVRVRSARLAWAEVTEVRTQRFAHRGGGTTLVMLDYPDAVLAVEGRMSGVHRSMAVVQRSAFGDSALGLPLNWSAADTEVLAGWLRSVRAAATAVE